MRVSRVGPIPAPRDVGEIARFSEDPELRVELWPGATMRTQYWNRRGELVRETLAIVNHQGFRGAPVEVRKAAGTFRIVCLGDSQTFGNGVDEGESWPAALEAALRESDLEPRIEVMNCGVGGYQIEQEVAYLEKRLLAFEPDLVVLGFFLNDTALPGASIESPSSSSRQLIHFLAPGRPGTFPKLRQYSRLLDLGADWLFRKLTMDRWIEQRQALYADDFEGWVRARSLMRKARTEVERIGGRFVVLLVPLLMRDGAELISAGPYRTVSAFCLSEGIPCFDPGALFADLEVDRLRVHERDLHSNSGGHRIVGRSLARWMREQGLVAGGSKSASK